MYNAFIFIAETLTQSSIITNEIAANKIYPVTAESDIEGDFLVYTASRDGITTKDEIAQYDVTLQIFGDNILEAIQKATIIEGVLIEEKNIRSRGASVQYTELLYRGYVELKLTLKI